jgi:hypothetical protein
MSTFRSIINSISCRISNNTNTIFVNMVFSIILSIFPYQLVYAENTKIKNSEDNVPHVHATELTTYERPLFGWKEKVKIIETDVVLHASLDPAAEMSTLQVEKLKVSKKNKQKMITITLTDRYGHSKTITRPLIREVYLRTGTGGKKARYSIPIEFCLGKILIREEVTISEQKLLTAPMRLGRNVLAGKVVVDPSQMFVMEPLCSDNIN